MQLRFRVISHDFVRFRMFFMTSDNEAGSFSVPSVSVFEDEGYRESVIKRSIFVASFSLCRIFAFSFCIVVLSHKFRCTQKNLGDILKFSRITLISLKGYFVILYNFFK